MIKLLEMIIEKKLYYTFFLYIRYDSTFCSIWLEHFVVHKPLIYIECACGPTRCRKKIPCRPKKLQYVVDKKLTARDSCGWLAMAPQIF